MLRVLTYSTVNLELPQRKSQFAIVKFSISEPTFTYSKLTIETLKQAVKYVQS